MAVLQINPIPPAEKIREAARQVLDRPEFAEPSRWYQSLIDMINAIREWLDRLGNWSEAHPALARVLFIIALVILLACLAHLLYLALADVLPFRRKRDSAAARPLRWEILQGAATNWREALDLARAMLNQGNPRRAVWIAHRVLLGLLDQQGAVKFAGWKTNSYYLGECAARPSLARNLRRAHRALRASGLRQPANLQRRRGAIGRARRPAVRRGGNRRMTPQTQNRLTATLATGIFVLLVAVAGELLDPPKQSITCSAVLRLSSPTRAARALCFWS